MTLIEDDNKEALKQNTISKTQIRTTDFEFVYKELRSGAVFSILFSGFIFLAFTLYKSEYAWRAFAAMTISGFAYTFVWALGFFDRLELSKAESPYESMLFKFNGIPLYIGSALLVGLMISAVVPFWGGTAGDRGYQDDKAGWNDGTYYDPKAGLPKGDKNRPDPCKVFESLCNNNSINVATLVSQGFEIKYADASSGEFILQKGQNAYTCQKIFPSVAGYSLAREAEIGSAICKQVRKGSVDDMDNYSSYSSETR